MKNLLKNYKKFTFVILVSIFLASVGIFFDSNSFFSVNKISLAAVPMGWNLNKVRSEIRRMEDRYTEYYYDGKDPRSKFMVRQEAAMEALRARQYDLEAAEAGFNFNTYDPKLFRPSTFASNGNPVPGIYYDPHEKSAPANNYNELFNNPENHMDPDLAAQMLDQESMSSEKNYEGEPWGGLVLSRIECTCEPPNYMVIMNDYVRNSQIFLKYETGKSRAYMYWDLQPNSYGLGTMDMGGICKIRVGQDCLNYQVTGVINSGPGFGSSAGSMGLSLPAGGIDFWDALGIDNPNAIPVSEGGTVPATYTF